MPITVVIADDHFLLRQGIRNVLELEQDIQVIAEAADGAEAVEKTQQLSPDILLLDMNMPKLNGVDVARRLKEQNCKTRIIVLTINDDESYVLETIKAGADGYLLKDVEPSMLIKAIHEVNSGESYIYPTLAKRLLSDSIRDTAAASAAERMRMPVQNGEDRLTVREIEILQLIAQGMSNCDIAHALFLSEKTVKNHLTNIFRKIGVGDRTQAALYAIKHKLASIK